MMNTVFIAICIYASLLVFYTMYIAAVNIYYDWGELKPWLRVVLSPFMAVFLALDFLINTGVSFLFLDPPLEFLLTQRLARYRSPGWPSGRRKQVATVICTEALNPFDPTRNHC